MKILHIIGNLDQGGAEKVLYDLVLNSDRSKFEHTVVSVSDLGYYGEYLLSAGIECYQLKVAKFRLFRVFKIFKVIKNTSPDIIQSWMYHSNLFTVILKLIWHKNIIWGIHSGGLFTEIGKKSTILVRVLGALFSKVPTKIIYCAESAAVEHLKDGYDKTKTKIITNGYDLTKYDKQSSELANQIRRRFGINEDTLVIGSVGRFHPVKDHKNLLDALKVVKNSGKKFKLIMIGSNLDYKNQVLMKWIKDNGLVNDIHLLGVREDLEILYPVMDVCVLSSRSEAFPNVVCEAMASGVPCVVTDVGDAARIVGETGYVVPKQNPKILAEMIIKMIEIGKEERIQLGIRARKRMEENYSLPKMIMKYENLYLEIANNNISLK